MVKKEEPAQPVKCKQDIYDDGIQVGMVAGPRSFTIEAWVKKVSRDSGQEVDWHFVGGRACILTLGDPDKVVVSMKRLFYKLGAAYEQCQHNHGLPPYRRIDISYFFE